MKPTTTEFVIFLVSTGLLLLTPRLLPLLAHWMSGVAQRLFSSAPPLESRKTQASVRSELTTTIQDGARVDELNEWLLETLDLGAVDVETLDLQAAESDSSNRRAFVSDTLTLDEDKDASLAVDNLSLATRMVEDAKPEPDEAAQLLAELKAERKDRPAAAFEHRPGRHQVALGETLRLIAYERLGDSSRWFEIWKMNYTVIRNPKVLLPGTVLRLPAVASSRAA